MLLALDEHWESKAECDGHLRIQLVTELINAGGIVWGRVFQCECSCCHQIITVEVGVSDEET